MQESSKFKCKLLTVFLVLCWIQIAVAENINSTGNYILCDITQSQNKCPENSACKQFSEGNQNVSRCDCLVDFKWNSNKTLCEKVETTTTAKAITEKTPTTKVPDTKEKVTTVPTPAPTPKVTTGAPTTVKPTPTNIATTEEPKKPNVTNSSDDSTKKAEEPGNHHVFGGILIPILVVVAIFGSVFAVKKFDLIERARDYFRGRHYHSNYEDILTMNNSDDDDPPLI